MAGSAKITTREVLLAPPRYYQEPGGDYLMVYSQWIETGEPRKLNIRAASLAGNPLSVSGAEIEPDYLRRCRRVTAAEVPPRWMASFLNFLRLNKTA